MTTDALVWEKLGDLAHLLDIRAYDSINLNGHEPCTKCGRLLSEHGVLVLPTLSIAPQQVLCPGHRFAAETEAVASQEQQPSRGMTAMHAILDEPAYQPIPQIEAEQTTASVDNKDEAFRKMEASMGAADVPAGLSSMRQASKNLDSMMRVLAPNFFKEAVSATDEEPILEQPQEAAEEPAGDPDVINTNIAMVTRTLSPEQILMLSGLHPHQPIVYEVEPADVGSGYQIVRYQNFPERRKLDALLIKDLPKYEIDELRLKLTVKAGYEWFIQVFGG